jgi:CRP-like cAMP-binding protein
MHISDLSRIRACSLFHGMHEKQVVSFLKEHSALAKDIAKDKIIAFRGDSYNELIILLKGSLSAEIINEKGKILKVETLESPTTIAGPILFATENQLPVQLRAETDIHILLLKKEDVITLLRQNPDALLTFLTDSGDKISFLSEKIRLYQFNTIKQKIAAYLLDTSGKTKSETFKLSHSIETIAELFGVSRPSLSRELTNMEEAGYFTRDSKSYSINKDLLLELMDDD